MKNKIADAARPLWNIRYYRAAPLQTPRAPTSEYFIFHTGSEMDLKGENA